MSSEITKKSELVPVPFEPNRIVLTKGQQILIDLLKESIQHSKIITRDDIEKCYFEFLKTKDGGRIVKYGMYTGEFYKLHSNKVRYGCLGWFKSNLGICILKGKLLAIPVIEFPHENELKQTV